MQHEPTFQIESLTPHNIAATCPEGIVWLWHTWDDVDGERGEIEWHVAVSACGIMQRFLRYSFRDRRFAPQHFKASVEAGFPMPKCSNWSAAEIERDLIGTKADVADIAAVLEAVAVEDRAFAQAGCLS